MSPRRFSLAFALLLFSGCREARSIGHVAGPVDAQVDAGASEAEPSDPDLCALPAADHVSLDGAQRFAPEYPPCPHGEPFCDSVEEPLDPKDTCFVANRNITRAERESRTTPPATTEPGPPWDGVTAPKYLDRIDAHFHLTEDERRLLRQNGFVVLDRVAYADYASAFHDVFQEQLPLYMGIDPILHAVFRGTELVLKRIEERRLRPALVSLLRKLRAGLRAARPALRAETALDLDLYLGVALGLADPNQSSLSLFGQDAEVRRILDLAEEAKLTTVEMFGRLRMVDFSQLTPRGHYVSAPFAFGEEKLDDYFRAVMWLSRLELNLVSRSCRSSHPGMSPDPTETPREATDALALAEIVERSGALVELRAFEEVYGVFAGRREDVSVPDLLRLARERKLRASDPDAPAKLAAAIGDKFQRTTRIHYMPEGTTVLPAIATLIGPRIVPDTGPLTRLVHDRVENRYELGAADVAYLLGHDRARHYLAADLAKHPTLGAELDAARAELGRAAAAGDVYAHWLRAVRAVSAVPAGTVPSFFRTDAYRDLRMNSALVGYGQLRHAFLLMAAQGYDAYGCEIPDAYVEPLVPVWDALLAHVRKVRSVVPGYAGLERVVSMLRDIAVTEISGAALSEPQRRWLAMVAEHVPVGGYGGDSGAPPTWTGWYFDMFEDREHGASRTSAFVADYFTQTSAGRVKYVGAEGPRLAIFVVDTTGAPRAMVGPVAKGYETETAIEQRLDDEKAIAHVGKRSPWRASFAAAPPPEPPIGLVGHVVECVRDGAVERRIAMRANGRVGKVSVTLLDHHADPLGRPATLDVDTSWRAVVFSSGQEAAEALHVHVHERAYHQTTSPSVFAWQAPPDDALPRRRRGVGDFSIGLPREK